jgi:UDPglucose--hexose-1-phosphate uridylyltransferase
LESAKTPNQRVARNPLLDDKVVQTPGRMNRREGIVECPFCADQHNGCWPGGQETWARPNDFPPLVPPTGEAYVLLYAREHNIRFAEMDVEQVIQVVRLWQDIYQELSSRYACVMTFENSGSSIGQTQFHPHGQTYGISFLPPTIDREMKSVLSYYESQNQCLFCDILSQEEKSERIVIDMPHWVGFIPSYARYPYEVHLYARSHISNLGILPRNGSEVRELAEALLQVIRGYHTVIAGDMPYMLVIHQLSDERFHLHIELLPVGRAPGKIKYAASVESGFGLWLNDSVPSEKAAELRAAMASN